MNKRVLVSGADGFIGNNLVKALLADGHKVTALSRHSMGYSFSHPNLKIEIGDILDKDRILDIAKNIDVIFHCAAFISFNPKDFARLYAINVTGTKNILEAAFYNSVKKAVFLSAASALGFSRDPAYIINEKNALDVSARNPYAYTKKLAENMTMDYASKGLDVSIANITTVYGTGDRKMNSGSLIKAIHKNQVKFAPPGGTSYVSMEDLLKGLILISEKGKRGERYIFCAENLRCIELFNRIAKALKSRSIEWLVPRWTRLPLYSILRLRDIFVKGSSDKVNIVTAEVIRESYFYKYYNSEKARRELGWESKVSLEESATKAMDFYLRERLI